MPRLNKLLADTPYSVFEELNRGLAERPGGGVPLHQGKTWFEPLAGSPVWGQRDFELAPHDHAPPAGTARLRRSIADHLSRHRGLDVHPDHVVVTAGATHGVSLALNAILDPGDEALVASPQWLFTAGLVEAAGGVAVEVPIFSRLADDPGFDFVGALELAVNERTRAVYFNTPNNPTGVCLGRAQLGALAEWAAARDLWVIADNAYENFDFTPSGFRDVSLDAPERTFSVYTFSKTYSMPGYRVGYTICPPAAAPRLRKWALYSVYSVPTVSQHAAACALAVPPAELARRQELARRARDLTTGVLAVPHSRIDGGMYAWLDLRHWAGGDPAGFVKACLDAGIGIAPGQAFGAHCEQRARLCFTAVPPERLVPALETINQIYAGDPS